MEKSQAAQRRASSAPEDTTLTVSLIASVAENGVIGAESGVPWSYPADLAHFKHTTSSHPVIAGRVTHEFIVDTIGQPLPNRKTIVLSTQATYDAPSVTSAQTIDTAVNHAAAAADTFDTDTIYIIGGKSVYEQFLPHADELVLTTIPESPTGDTHFPDWDMSQWTRQSRTVPGNVVITTYRRK